ncbi:MAG: glutathione S-transferase family protein [Pseudomonadota bacterium]
MTIYGDRISGNCLKVKWTADHLGLSYQWVDVSVLEGEARSDDFLRVNPFGQVPAVEFADGHTLAQSNAIIFALAERAGSTLVPSDAFQRAAALSWMFWEQYSHEPAIAVRRFLLSGKKTPTEEIDPALYARGERALSHMEARLQSAWLVGDAPTVADISLVAYTRVADEGGFDLGDYPNVKAWVGRVEREFDIPKTEGRF